METQENSSINNNQYHQYLIFWLGQRISYLGSEIVQFALIWWLTETSRSATILSLGMLITILPKVFLSSFAGILADKFDRKKVIAIADGLQALTTLSLILLIWVQDIAIWLILGFNGLRAIFQTFHDPATNAVASVMVPRDKLAKINGMNQLIRSIIDMLCPILAVLLMSVFSIQSILWVDIITFGVAITTIFIIKIPRIKRQTNSVQKGSNEMSITNMKTEFLEGIQGIRSVKGLASIFLIVALTNLFLSPFNVLSMYFVNVIHGGTAVDMAILSIAFQVGMLLGALTVSLKKEWRRKALTMVISVVCVFIGIIFMALTPTGNFYWMSIGGFIITFLIPMFSTLMMTIIQTTVPREKMGRIYGIFATINSATMLVGFAVSGPLADLIGVVPLYISSSILAIISVVLLYLFSNLRELDKLEIDSIKLSAIEDRKVESNTVREESVETPIQSR